MTTPRDAFITSLCKSALPPHYTLTVVNPHSGTAQVSFVRQSSSSAQTSADGTSGGSTGTDSGRSSPGSGAVVTGVPLGTSHGPVSVSIGCFPSSPE